MILNGMDAPRSNREVQPVARWSDPPASIDSKVAADELSIVALVEQCGAMIDRLRASSQPGEVPPCTPMEPGEAQEQARRDTNEVWEMLQTALPDSRSRRLAYLLYHSGLKPREIVRLCPQEWSDIQEIYRLRRNIIARIMPYSE